MCIIFAMFMQILCFILFTNIELVIRIVLIKILTIILLYKTKFSCISYSIPKIIFFCFLMYNRIRIRIFSILYFVTACNLNYCGYTKKSFFTSYAQYGVEHHLSHSSLPFYFYFYFFPSNECMEIFQFTLF